MTVTLTVVSDLAPVAAVRLRVACRCGAMGLWVLATDWRRDCAAPACMACGELLWAEDVWDAAWASAVELGSLDALRAALEVEDMARIDDGPWTGAGATFSPNRRYRYRLWREWEEALPRCVFVMLNPSVADETKLDPTVRRCVGFARRWGCGSLDVVNVFAYVDGNPQVMVQQDNPVGSENDRHILDAVAGAGIVVAAWSCWAEHLDRGPRVMRMLRDRGVALRCLGTTVDGYPRHPLYLASDTPLEGFPPEKHAAHWERVLGGLR